MAEWWRGGVVYQIYPRSFQDSDGDGVGDLRGIIARLPHVADLGAEAVWLSPFFPSPMADMGYDVSDYRGVDPVFGTLADFDALVARAHGLGLKVIIDQVLSHSSDRHPAFAESRQDRTNPRADWYVWADPRPDGTPPTNWLSVFGGPAWTWDARRRQYYLHNFLSCQPDFNFHNPEVQDWHLDNMAFWLDRGVDGFRLDTVNYYVHDAALRDNPPDRRPKPEPEANPYGMQDHRYDKNRPENLAWLARIRGLLDRYGGERMALGEVGDGQYGLQLMAAYTAPGLLHQCYSFEMMGREFTAAGFRRRIAAFRRAAPKGWPMWAFSNHDVSRHVSRWAGHAESPEALARLCAAMLLSFPGSICLWQGEELGQTDTELAYEELTDPQGIAFWPAPVGRDPTRTPMVWDNTANGGFTKGRPWLPVKPPQAARHVAGQAGRVGSVLEFYRAMLAFRRATPALCDGAVRFLTLPEPVLAFVRGEGPGAVTCAFNLSPGAVTLRGAGRATLAGPSQAARLECGALHLGPNGAAFLTGTVRLRI